MRLWLFILLIVGMIVYACTPVAVTGRKQLNLVSNAEIIALVNQQYDSIIRKGPLSKNREQTEMVKRVGAKIQKAVESYMASKNYVELQDYLGN